MPVIMPNALTECKTEVSYLVLSTLGTYKWLWQSYVIILVRFICIMEDNMHFFCILQFQHLTGWSYTMVLGVCPETSKNPPDLWKALVSNKLASDAGTGSLTP